VVLVDGESGLDDGVSEGGGGLPDDADALDHGGPR
jgi:hypothetical protein